MQIHLLFRHSYLNLQGVSHDTQRNKGNYITNTTSLFINE